MQNLPYLPAWFGSLPLLFLAVLAAFVYSLVQLALTRVRKPRQTPGADSPGDARSRASQARMRTMSAPAAPAAGPGHLPGQLPQPNAPAVPPAPPRQPRIQAHHPPQGAWRQRPSTPSPAQPGSDTGVYANILLGVAAAFLVIAAFIFVGIAQHAVLRAVAVIGTAVITYAAGLVISLLSSRLKPIGTALTAVGLVLLPISGAALGGLDITGAKTAWVAASALGLVGCALAAALLRSELVTWFGLLFVGSAVLSVMSFGGPSFAYYGVGLVIVSTAFIIIGRVLEGPRGGRNSDRARGAAGFRSVLSAPRGQQVRWARPFGLLGQIIAPASGICALITLPDDSPWAKGVFWLALTAFYVVLGFCRSWTYALSAALLTSAAGITSLTGSVCRTVSPAGADDAAAVCSAWGPTAGIAAGFVQILVLTAVLPVFARRGRKLTLLIALHISGAILTVSVLAAYLAPLFEESFSGASAADADPHVRELVTAMTAPMHAAGVVLLLAGLVCAWSAWRADSVFLQSASALSLLASPCIGTAPVSALAHWIWTAALLVMSAVMVIGHSALSFASRTRRGRGRPQLRAMSTIAVTVISAAGGLPFTLLVWSDGSQLKYWASLIGAAAAIAAFVGAAFVFRSASVSLAALCAAFGASGALGYIISRFSGVNYSAALFIPLAGIGAAVLWAVWHRLKRTGRTRRAGGAIVVSIVWAAAPISGVIRHTLPNTEGRALSAGVVMITAGVAAVLAAAAVQTAAAFLRRQQTFPTALSTLAVPAIVFASAVWGVQITRFIGVPTAAIAIAFALTAVAIAWMSLSLSFQWLQVPAGLTLLFSLSPVFTELTDRSSLGLLLSSWSVWAAAYGGHWLLTLLRRTSLASLVTAGLALLTALFALLFVTIDVAWLDSPRRSAAGVTFAIAALMAFGAARSLKNPRSRLACMEAASYLGTLALMLAISGFGGVRFVVLWHLPTAVAVAWGLLLAHRAQRMLRPESQPMNDGLLSAFEARIIIPWVILTIAGLASAAGGPGWLTVLFLADHVVLLVIGALTSRTYAVWWGIIASAGAVFWGLRNLVWLALVLLALMLIGVVVWMLLRPKKARPTPAAAPAYGRNPHLRPAPGAQRGKPAAPPADARPQQPMPQHPQPPQHHQRPQPPRNVAGGAPAEPPRPPAPARGPDTAPPPGPGLQRGRGRNRPGQ